MRTHKWVALVVGMAGVAVLQSAGWVRADIASDRAAAIVLFPKLVVESVSVSSVNSGPTGNGYAVDTIVQISNTSADLVRAHCFYIDASSRCSITGYACDPNAEVPCDTGQPKDQCLPGWVETDFNVVLTPRQPLAWSVSKGLPNKELPLDGIFRRGIGGSSNIGTGIPPAPVHPTIYSTNADTKAESFVGELKCIAVDGEGRAIAQNALKGEATIVNLFASFGVSSTQEIPNVEKYSAIGIQAIEGDANGDNVLELGGGSNEYNGCSNILIADHFFDFATNPITGEPVVSDLTLVPCTQDLRNQEAGSTTVQYLVFNEFEQRFSTSKPVDCFFESQLSRIDTRNPERSIFSVYVSGTLTGQTRIRGVQTGLLGIVRESGPTSLDYLQFYLGASSAFNLQMQGERPTGDRIVLP